MKKDSVPLSYIILGVIVILLIGYLAAGGKRYSSQEYEDLQIERDNLYSDCEDLRHENEELRGIISALDEEYGTVFNYFDEDPYTTKEEAAAASERMHTIFRDYFRKESAEE